MYKISRFIFISTFIIQIIFTTMFFNSVEILFGFRLFEIILVIFVIGVVSFGIMKINKPQKQF